MGRVFDYFVENPYWKNIYDNAPSEECKEYYQIMFDYFSFDSDEEDVEGIEPANDEYSAGWEPLCPLERATRSAWRSRSY